jgi:hypothetical protein
MWRATLIPFARLFAAKVWRSLPVDEAARFVNPNEASRFVYRNVCPVTAYRLVSLRCKPPRMTGEIIQPRVVAEL